MRKMTKEPIVLIFFLKLKTKTRRARGGWSEVQIFISRDRERDFSLDLRAIGPSKSFRPRRKADLRGETYAWTLILGSFVKLREVGVLSYLGFTLCLSTLLMLELIEAVRDRLIGPKSWD